MLCKKGRTLIGSSSLESKRLSLVKTFINKNKALTFHFFLAFTNEGGKDFFKPGISTLNARNLALLQYVPFAVPFLQRVMVSWVCYDYYQKNVQ